MHVAEAVKIVLKSNQPYISIVLDQKRIQTLHMEDSFDSIKNSILNHRLLKSKVERITLHGKGKLRIFPRMADGKDQRKGQGKDKRKLYFELHSLISMLPTVMVKGISTVDRAVINCQRGKYNLLIEGTNLLAVMGTSGVDGSKTKSNHVMEIWQTLGTEAARQSVISEIHDTMRSHGMSIDARHRMLLADVMTYKGEVLGITRFGMTKTKDSVLMLASFEKTSEHLFNASMNGWDDHMEGVSENIIMGVPMRLGTGLLKVRHQLEI